MANTYTNLVAGAALGLSMGIGSAYAPLQAQEVKGCGFLTVVTKDTPEISWVMDTLPVSGRIKADLDKLIGRDGYWESGNHFKKIVDGLQDMKYRNSIGLGYNTTDDLPRKIHSVRYVTGKCLF